MYNRYICPESHYASPQERPPEGFPGGLGSLFSGLGSLLPKNLDAGDLLLLGLLLLLYMDSKDEEFLIILAVVALSIFREK